MNIKSILFSFIKSGTEKIHTDKDIYFIAESKIGIEPELLDKPMAELD